MKKKGFLFILMTFSQFYLPVFAQSGPESSSTELKTGDKLPDIELSGIKNFPNSSMHLSDLNDKVLILDFWATHCASCIESLPHLQEMQERFKDKLLIILVNYEEDVLVSTFLKKMERVTGQKVRLPMINGDSILVKEFRHDGVPHVVWIHQGYLRGITAASRDLNDSNILAVTHGANIFSSIKLLDYGKNTPHAHLPFFANGNGGDGSGIQHLSVLSKYIPDASSYYTFSSTEIMATVNVSIKDLYQLAYNDDGICLRDNRTILDVKDSTKYTGQQNNPNDSDRLYTYQLFGPNTSRKEFFGIMRADLTRYFKLKARFVKRKMPCYVLTAEDTTLLIHKPDPKNHGDKSVHNFEIYFQDGPVSDLIGWIVQNIVTYQLSKYPVVDHTGIRGNVDLYLECDVSDPKAMDRALYEKYKMHLRLEEAIVNVLVISE
jgi:uncharacterized protein (TIGR03435 family)